MSSFSATRALTRLGFKQTIRGAIILGIFSGIMLSIQGVAYQKGYPDEASRAQFAKSLSAAPALGLIYGDSKNLSAGTTGYMFYRSVGFLGLVASVWAILVATRLLRGNEEDGRWEVVRSGAITARGATRTVLRGFGMTFAIAWLISLVITTAMMHSSDISLSFGTNLAMQACIFLPALLFALLAALTSQLGMTRGRAIVYALVPAVAFFFLRGIGNTYEHAHWLLYATPFGWAELVNPILNMHKWWFVPFIVFAALFAVLGVRLAQRDLGESVIRQSQEVRSRSFLLKTDWQIALRQNMWQWVAWALSALVLISMIAALTTVAINATESSSSLADSVRTLAHNSADLKVAFLGAGMVFLVMVLLVMAANIIGGIRADEGRQYLDNILVGPQRRTAWLTRRLVLGFLVMLGISLLSGLVLYAIAAHQHVPLNFGKVMATSVAVMGTVGFLLGLGSLLFGLLPRLASMILYAALAWSFLIILLGSALKLNTVVLHSSLFQYASFNLAAWPDWKTFAWLMVFGIVLTALGITAFAKRDIVVE